MNGILIAFSQTAVNVLGVYFKLQTFVFMPVFGLNQGALPVMGYNYGARNRRRLMGAYRITLTAAVVIMALGLVLFQLLPEQMLMLFVDRTDAAAAQEMIEVGVPALKTISLSFLGAAFGIINSTLFQATARGMNSLIVSVCRQLVVILPAAGCSAGCSAECRLVCVPDRGGCVVLHLVYPALARVPHRTSFSWN